MFTMNFKETELRLGLPGRGGGEELGKGLATGGKRVYEETIDLELNLQTDEEKCIKKSTSQSRLAVVGGDDPSKPPVAKAQVVGWPPVRSFRKNILAVQSSKIDGGEKPNGPSATFVKVSMDGAPYLRKVDLKMYKTYQDLSIALEKMFSSFTSGNCGPQGMNRRDFMNESKLMDLLSGSEYVPTYEDKDGDWMLVGDVPWEMFVKSCKRVRIMKGSEAIGIAPRAMEKCKSRG